MPSGSLNITATALWLVLGFVKLGNTATGVNPGGTRARASGLSSGRLPPFFVPFIK